MSPSCWFDIFPMLHCPRQRIGRTIVELFNRTTHRKIPIERRRTTSFQSNQEEQTRFPENFTQFPDKERRNLRQIMLFGDIIPGNLGLMVDVLLLVHLLAVVGSTVVHVQPVKDAPLRCDFCRLPVLCFSLQLYWIVATCRQPPASAAVWGPGDSVLKKQKPSGHHQD